MLVLCLFGCAPERIAGSGTGEETTNGRVTGIVTDSMKLPVKGVEVRLTPQEYDPVRDTAPPPKQLTDSAGRYTFIGIDSGTYLVRSMASDQGLGAVAPRFSVRGDTVRPDVMQLEKTGSIRVRLPSDAAKAGGYVYIQGIGIYAYIVSGAAWVQLDSVPPGRMSSVVWAASKTAQPKVIRYDVPVAPAQIAGVDKPDWRYAHVLRLNTASSGADVAGTVVNFPVLVRLTGEIFNFDQAQSSGEDIRFTSKDSLPLVYEIERWDAANKLAEIWVKTDTIRGGDSIQTVCMYWGNPQAALQSSPQQVFDTAAGFSGVWHLGLPAGTVAADATFYADNGTATATVTISGPIGMARMFNGSSSMVRITGPSLGKLNFDENSAFSVYAWVQTNALDSMFHSIVCKSNLQYGLQMRPKNKWEFCTFSDQTRWEMTRGDASDNRWHLLVGVRSGARQYLYVDGVCADSSIATSASTLSRAMDQPLDIGHCPDGGTDPDRFFNGSIDEVRIAKTAYGADWIRLCYTNQRENDALVKW